MFQKLPLTLCSHTFVSLNVNRTVFRRVLDAYENPPSTPQFIIAYMNRPSSLDSFPLIEAARSWSFSPHRQQNQWKQISPPIVLHILP